LSAASVDITSQTTTVTVADNTVNAFALMQGTNSYIALDTANASESLNFGNIINNPDFNFVGTGSFTQSGNGQVSLGGNLDANAGIDITGGNLTVGGANFSVDVTNGNLNTAGDLAVNGGDITSTSNLNISPSGDFNLTAQGTGAFNFTGNSGLQVIDGGFTLTSTGVNSDLIFNAGRDLVFDDSSLISAIALSNGAPTLNSGDTAIIEAINSAYDAATGVSGGMWERTNNLLYPGYLTYRVAIGTKNTSIANSSLYVTRDLASGALGKSLVIFDQSEAEDIFTASSSGTTRFVIQKDGNVGIGTASPSNGYMLDVAGAGRFTGGLTVTNGIVDLPDGVIDNRELANSDIGLAGDTGTGGVDLGNTLSIIGGEGLDVTISSGAFTLNSEDASDTNKGIASFASNNFIVNSGAVTIATGGIGSQELGVSGVALGSYGAADQVSTFTVDEDGRLTSASSVNIMIGSSNITDNSLDFVDFSNSMTLDSSTSVNTLLP